MSVLFSGKKYTACVAKKNDLGPDSNSFLHTRKLDVNRRIFMSSWGR